MRVEIFEESKQDEKVLRLRLVKSVSGGIHLAAVDKAGNRVDGGWLARIDTDGIHLAAGVDSSIGIALDATHRVKVTF